MKFAHIADPHLGSWNNHPDMKDYPLIAFKEAIEICINSGVDFLVITGDLFDSSIPPIDVIRCAANGLRRCKEHGLRVYSIPGSHDFSPTGKTMLSVFEDAGLLTNVAESEENGNINVKILKDKTGAVLSGMLGRKGGLEKSHYDTLPDMKEKGFKIFLFHTAIAEYRSAQLKEMDAIPLSSLPKGFDYYAGGHVHSRSEHVETFGTVIFPGALFPTSFDELEKSKPGFYIVHYDKTLNPQWIELGIAHSMLMEFVADGKSAKRVEDEILKKADTQEVKNKIILIKIKGVLETGKPSDIDFKLILEKAQKNGAKTIKKNISGLSAKDFEDVEIKKDMTIEELEKEIISEHCKTKIPGLNEENTKSTVLDLMNIMMDEKAEGESIAVYDERIKSGAKRILGV